jgi:hypothetical protein
MMTFETPYPPFIPPAPLAEKTPPEWSRAEAKAYAEWLGACRDDRRLALIRFFGMDQTAPPVSLLAPLGERVAAALRADSFARGGRLTNEGHAVAADMGLLLAAALQQTNTHLSWDVVLKPKSDVSYHQPVLVGFGVLVFDPLLISTTQAFGVAKGTKDGTAWQRVFDYWSELARNSAR